MTYVLKGRGSRFWSGRGRFAPMEVTVALALALCNTRTHTHTQNTKKNTHTEHYSTKEEKWGGRNIGEKDTARKNKTVKLTTKLEGTRGRNSSDRSRPIKLIRTDTTL